MLRGPAAIGHPWPGAALAASMPLDPLRTACVRPAPKSRSVSSEVSRKRVTRAGANALRFFGTCINRLLAFLTVGARLPAICREPAAKPVHAECQVLPSRLILLPLPGRSRDKPRSYGLRPESKAADPPQSRVWPEGTHVMPGTALLLPERRRSALARDLPGTGSKTCACGVSGKTESPDLLPLRGRSRASALLQDSHSRHFAFLTR